MPHVSIYNDSESDVDCDFDVIEVIDGKEVSRKTLPADQERNQFRLAFRNQAFVIVPVGVTWPLEIVTEQVTGYRRKTPAPKPAQGEGA